MVTDILHLQGKQLTAYRGNYDTFERTRDEQLKNKQKAFEANERTRAHMQVLVYIFDFTTEILSVCGILHLQQLRMLYLLVGHDQIFSFLKLLCCRHSLTSSVTMRSVRLLFNQESR